MSIQGIARWHGGFAGSILVLLAWGCSDAPPIPKQVAFDPKPPATAIGSEMASQALSGIEDVRAGLDARYRLAPDRRFLLAAGQLHSFFTEAPPEAATAQFTGGRWQISVGGEALGELSALPDFGELFALLEAIAGMLHAAQPLTGAAPVPEEYIADVQRGIQAFLLPHPARVLRALDTRWAAGAYPTALLPLASEALTAATIQMVDYTQISDAMPAQALAVTALTKALEAGDTVREECLLARRMGYTRFAQEHAQELEPQDPVRLYAEYDDLALLEAALQPEALPRTRMLAFQRVEAQGHLPLLEKTAERLFPSTDPGSTTFPLVEPLLRAYGDQVGDTLLIMVAMEAAADGQAPPALSNRAAAYQLAVQDEETYIQFMRDLDADLNRQGLSLLEAYRQAIHGLDERYTGPFLPAELWRGYYQAAMHTALFTKGRHFTNFLGSVPPARQYVTLLEQAGGEFFGGYTAWYRGLINAMAGDITGREQWEAAIAKPELPVPLLLASHEELKREMGWADPAGPVAVQHLASRLDSRPAHRAALANRLYEDVLDLERAEHLYRSLFEISPAGYQHLLSWWGYFIRDAELLHEVLAIEHPTPNPSYRALNNLHAMGAVDDAFVRAEYERLIAVYPDDYGLRDAYSRYLERQGALEQARQILLDWLNREVAGGARFSMAGARVAALYQKEGEYQEVLETIAPLDSYRGSVMVQRVRALVHLGQRREASAAVRRMLDRYPQSAPMRAVAAWAYWSASDHAGAARVLTESPHPLRTTDYRDQIAREFFDVFEDRPSEQTVEAFQALVEAGLDRLDLGQLSEPFAWAEDYETAFALSSQLKGGGMAGAMLSLRSYRHLSALRSPEEAAAWLREQVPNHILAPMSMEIYRDPNKFALLWELYPDPGAVQHGEMIWLLRACAALREGIEEHPKREALMAYYVAPSDNPYDLMGKHLLGLASVQDLLVLAADNPKRLCEVAYYIGLRAHTEGRLREAADWYHTSVATGLLQNGEYRWAHDALHTMKKRTAALSVQEQEPTLFLESPAEPGTADDGLLETSDHADPLAS